MWRNTWTLYKAGWTPWEFDSTGKNSKIRLTNKTLFLIYLKLDKLHFNLFNMFYLGKNFNLIILNEYFGKTMFDIV